MPNYYPTGCLYLGTDGIVTTPEMRVQCLRAGTFFFEDGLFLGYRSLTPQEGHENEE